MAQRAGGYLADIAAGRLIPRKIAPWLIAWEIILVAHEHWKELDRGDRARLAELLRKSKGQPQNLTERERTQLREIAGRLQVLRFARNAATAAAIGRKRAKKRRAG